MYRCRNGQITLADFRQPAGMNQKGAAIGEESPDDPLAGEREAVRRSVYQPQGQRSQAAFWRIKSAGTERIPTIARHTGSGAPVRHRVAPGRAGPETGLRIAGISASVWRRSAGSVWRNANAAWSWLLQTCGNPLLT